MMPSRFEGDRSQFIRMEENEGRKEYVLLDADGPGAVVRFWATWHGPGGGPFSNGTIRVYIDRGEEPTVEGKMTDFIDQGFDKVIGRLSQPFYCSQ